MLKTINYSRYSLLLFSLFLTTLLSAQNSITSPYSRFGIGDLAGNNSAWIFSMGGTGVAFRSPSHINTVNPASYTAFDSVSFVFEGGILLNSVQLKTSTQSVSRNYASLGYLVFGFPVTSWWKTTIGIFPVSNVGYNISTISNQEGIGHVLHTYTGEGGINRFNWGNGFRIGKNLSIGVNSSYLFGNINRRSLVLFPDSIKNMNTAVDNNITVSSFYFDFGVQYRIKLKKDVDMVIGGIFSPKTGVRAKTDTLARTFVLASDASEVIKDTITQSVDTHTRIMFPLSLGFGISFEKQDHWLVGADFKWENWKSYTAFGRNDSLVNSFQINVGAELLPNINAYSNYLKRIRYRLGFNYNNTYLDLRGKQLNDYAFSLGFGLPVHNSKTGVNLGVQIGSRGTTQADLIKETYFKFVIGFTIYERWFVKRKYF
jgi:hypothetical protein